MLYKEYEKWIEDGVEPIGGIYYRFLCNDFPDLAVKYRQKWDEA